LFDPARLSWTNNVPFLDYSTPKGRDYLRRCHAPLQLAASKWNLVLPPTFDFKWGDVWDPERAKKEATLLWQLWHWAIAVNVWRGKISNTIVCTCPMCDLGADESLLHHFWSCPCSQKTWTYTSALMKHFAAVLGLWEPPDWK
jgi:hypothetical protein